jgi:hypothetical protein
MKNNNYIFKKIFNHLNKYLILIVFLIFSINVYAQDVGEELLPWQEGYFDIHHINTENGDATFMIMPDGTTMLIDAGDKGKGTISEDGIKPNASHSPGEWIIRYIKHYLSWMEKPVLDYAIISHFHGDHMGSITETAKTKMVNGYYLTGLTEVGEYIPIRKLIDRNYPDYDYPSPMQSGMIKNYRQFIEYSMKNRGLKVERAKPGSNKQVVLVHEPEKFLNFDIRIIAASGELWTGIGDAIRQYLPINDEIDPNDPPEENSCSIVSRFSYGKFDYYTGGDIQGIPDPGRGGFQDIETPVARVVGPVEVCKANHHGFPLNMNSYFVKALKARTYVFFTYDQMHISEAVMSRIFSTRLYRGPRQVFSTGIHEATKAMLTIMGWYDRITGTSGHIVVRVEPGGDSYWVFTLDDTAETYKITGKYGPYESN